MEFKLDSLIRPRDESTMGRWEDAGTCERCGGTMRRYHGPNRTEEDITTGRRFEYRDGEISDCWTCSAKIDRLVEMLPALIWRRDKIDAMEAAANEPWQLERIRNESAALEADQTRFNEDAAKHGATIHQIFDLYKMRTYKNRGTF